MHYLLEKNSCRGCSAFSKSLFNTGNEECHNKLSKNTSIFRRGELLFSQSQPSESAFCIMSGTVQLFRSGPTREQTFDIVSSSSLIGHRDLLLHEPYGHTARCQSEVITCRIERNSLEELISNNQELNNHLLQNVLNSWKFSESINYSLGALKVVERVASYIISEMKDCSSCQVNGSEKPVISLKTTREVLATHLGTTTESVIRTLSDFKSRGWIDLYKSKLVIIEPTKLRSLVQK